MWETVQRQFQSNNPPVSASPLSSVTARGPVNTYQNRVEESPGATTQYPLLRLQRQYGNRYVQRILQSKLAIGSPDDAYEKEADQVAAQVTSSSTLASLEKCAQPGSAGSDEDCSEYGSLAKRAGLPSPGASPRSYARDVSELRRKCSCGSGAENECTDCQRKRLGIQRVSSSQDSGASAPPVVDEVLATPGRPLGDSVRRKVEPAFGYDFSSVRVHDDVKAAESARSVNAVAYTVGDHIVFDENQYSPGTISGDHLLAHELTHTIQQTGGTPKGLQRQASDETDDQDKTPQSSGFGELVGEVVGAVGGVVGAVAEAANNGLGELAGGGSQAAEAVGGAALGVVETAAPAVVPTPPPPAAAACPVSPARPFTANNAALHGPVAGSSALGACDWGLTFPEAVRATISARCDGTNWFAVLTGLTGDFSQQVRLLPSEHEVTGGNTTSTNFCDQATELHDLGHCGGAWYKLAAVKAHEDVHLTRFKPALVAQAPTIEATITALSVPDAPGKTAAKAATEIAALPAFATALATAQATWLAEVLVRVAHDHDGGGPCETAEHGVVDPVVTSICGKATTNKWGACGVCP